jgi:hypothetical protein
MDNNNINYTPFQPIYTSRTTGKSTYNNLSEMTLTHEQKKWLIDGIKGINTNKVWTDLNITSYGTASKQYTIAKSTIKGWAKLIKNGKVLQPFKGRVNAISDKNLEIVNTQELDARSINRPSDARRMHQLLNEARRIASLDCGKSIHLLESVPELCDKTHNIYLCKLQQLKKRKK